MEYSYPSMPGGKKNESDLTCFKKAKFQRHFTRSKMFSQNLSKYYCGHYSYRLSSDMYFMLECSLHLSLPNQPKVPLSPHTIRFVYWIEL